MFWRKTFVEKQQNYFRDKVLEKTVKRSFKMGKQTASQKLQTAWLAYFERL